MTLKKLEKTVLLILSLDAALIPFGAIALADMIKDNTPRPIKYVTNLVVNTSKSYKTAVYESESAGIEQIRILIEKSPLEESWAYLPKKELWIETGINEYNKPEGAGVSYEQPSLRSILKENDEIILYHFHPKWKDWLVYEALPSNNDLDSMVSISKQFYEQHPDGLITEKMCSYYGLTEYWITKSGLESFSKIKALQMVKTPEFERLSISRHIIEESVLTGISLNVLNGDRVCVNFIPYSALQK